MKNLIRQVIFLLLAGFQVPSAVAWAGTGQAQPETLVHTQDAEGQAALKPIASLKLGDMVLAKSEWKAQGESLSYEPITDIMVTPAQPRRLVDLVLADGQTLTTTDGHPFNTPEGWRDAILLKKGGKLLLKGDGESEKTVEIASVTHRLDTQTTYNLEVANAHTFFVGEDGVLVHNGKGYNPPPRGPLPGFPDSKRNGETAGRARWDLPDGDFCLWDRAHGRAERYNKRGKHQGEFDANTGEPTKPRNPNYDLDKGDF